jgi:flagellar hook-associated protein 2
MGKEMVEGNITIPISEGATRVNGQDARIILNDAEFTSDSNTFSINGLTIKALNTTKENEPLTITTDTDTQGLYDKVKDFLSQYNTLINELCSLYNADSASGYEPLTDDEKSEMSDSDIEKWETKIKDSLLRRDSTISGVMNAMTGAMMKTYTVNGKTYSLASFGIKTLGYLNAAANENYAYHIDGDEDDDVSSGNTDKLMAALNSDPDSVVDFMKQLTSGLYTALDNKMKSSSLSSAYTIYNDKQMASEYSSYTKLISTWEDKISDMEERYYSKFSSMETALSKLQSSSSSISSLFSS